MEVVRLPSWIYLHYLRLSLCLLLSFLLISLPRSQKQVSASHNLHCALPDHPLPYQKQVRRPKDNQKASIRLSQALCQDLGSCCVCSSSPGSRVGPGITFSCYVSSISLCEVSIIVDEICGTSAELHWPFFLDFR